MNYSKFCEILNKHIFECEKRELLKKIADHPERFIGLFRPSKPGTKILQHLLQSHEIRFGDALEELLEKILKDLGYSILPKNITTNNQEQLSLDQFFTDGKNYYFIEHKIRDDHDSTKKRGQIQNFEAKLEELFKKYENKLIGIMYFIDPDLEKNKNFYKNELIRLTEYYRVPLHLFYGKELFEFLRVPKYWEKLLQWLKDWKESLPEIPEINFDVEPQKSFEEIKDLEIRYWRKLLENEKIWEEGIIKAIFKNGETLKLILNYFQNQTSAPYQRLFNLLKEKLEKYY
uniref:type II site-specific deoxyribonuclease n=1 Tax=Thermodesulfobacterium geofontis TaxID=1295609 RepID=A0A7V6CDK9_9BACT